MQGISAYYLALFGINKYSVTFEKCLVHSLTVFCHTGIVAVRFRDVAVHLKNVVNHIRYAVGQIGIAIGHFQEVLVHSLSVFCHTGIVAIHFRDWSIFCVNSFLLPLYIISSSYPHIITSTTHDDKANDVK